MDLSHSTRNVCLLFGYCSMLKILNIIHLLPQLSAGLWRGSGAGSCERRLASSPRRPTLSLHLQTSRLAVFSTNKTKCLIWTMKGKEVNSRSFPTNKTHLGAQTVTKRSAVKKDISAI